MQYLSILDLFTTPVFFILIYFISRFYAKGKIEKYPYYKYYVPGVMMKCLGGVSLCLVYCLYYGGGDTTGYFFNALCMKYLLLKNPSYFYDVMFHYAGKDQWYYFDNDTNYPYYLGDPPAFFVVRLISPVIFFCFDSFVLSSLIIGWFSFNGVWKLFEVMIDQFPKLEKQFAMAIFFVPSVIFWGSGILKDTITLSATGYFVFSIYQIFFKRQKIFANVLLLFVSVYLILSIKPYIFVGILPGTLIWLLGVTLGKIRGTMMRAFFLPILLIVMIGGGFGVLLFMSDSLSAYSLDSILEKAVDTQQDLKRDYYQGNTFDIGDYDATLSSMLSKAPLAINASLFRPFILEANNPVMLASSIENLWILFFTLQVLWRTKVINFFRYIFSEPMLIFCFTFSMFFSFSVGITTSNFGSLVRYKIPMIPFYMCLLYMINEMARLKKARDMQEDVVHDEGYIPSLKN